MGLGRTLHAIGASGYYSARYTGIGEDGQRIGRVVVESRVVFFVGFGQGNPGLDAVEAAAALAHAVETLGMTDARSRRHPVQGSRQDVLMDAQAVAVGSFHLEQYNRRSTRL